MINFCKDSYIIPLRSINYVHRIGNAINIHMKRPVAGVAALRFVYNTEAEAIDAFNELQASL